MSTERDTLVRYVGHSDVIEVEVPEEARGPEEPRHARVRRLGTLLTTAEQAESLTASPAWAPAKSEAEGLDDLTVAQLDEAFGQYDGYPHEAKRDEKLEWLHEYGIEAPEEEEPTDGPGQEHEPQVDPEADAEAFDPDEEVERA